MRRDHEDEYRRTESELHAFLRRSGEIFSDEQPVDILGDCIEDDADQQAQRDHLISLLDDDDAPAEQSAQEAAPAPADTTPEANAALAKRNAMLRDYKPERKKRLGRNRVRKHRAGKTVLKKEPDTARLKALLRATTRGSNKSMEQHRGKEQALVSFRNSMGFAAYQHGAKFSLKQLADIHSDFTGEPFTRDQARRWRETVEKLEAAGGPWHNL